MLVPYYTCPLHLGDVNCLIRVTLQRFDLMSSRHTVEQRRAQIEHRGVDDALIEEASVTWYFNDGQWLN